MNKASAERTDPLHDIHHPDFWAQDTANITAAFARFQAMPIEEASVNDLKQFAAETLRLLNYTRQIVKHLCPESQPTLPRPARETRPRGSAVTSTENSPSRCEERSISHDSISHDSERLEAMLDETVAPNRRDETRRALLEWARQMVVDRCLEAGMDEIARFADAGKTQAMYSVEQIQSYFMDRLVTLRAQQAEGTTDE